jgi:hypothetical protein
MAIGEKRPLPRYGEAPVAISHALAEIGRLWAESVERPRVSPDLRQAWDQLIDQWADSALPLVIRKSGNIRGAALLHETGREIVLADNSPAQWAFMRAYTGHRYTLANIRDMLGRDVIPFAYATKAAEKAQMKFRCTLAGADNVNKCGWKLCHVYDIGLSTRTPVSLVPLETLVRHFKLFMKPSNHFVVPLAWSGLGEVREVIEAIRRVDAG